MPLLTNIAWFVLLPNIPGHKIAQAQNCVRFLNPIFGTLQNDAGTLACASADKNMADTTMPDLKDIDSVQDSVTLCRACAENTVH